MKTTTAAQIWLCSKTVGGKPFSLHERPPVIFARPRVARAVFVNIKMICTKTRNQKMYLFISRKKPWILLQSYFFLFFTSLSSVELYICALLQTQRQTPLKVVSSYGRHKSVFTNTAASPIKKFNTVDLKHFSIDCGTLMICKCWDSKRDVLSALWCFCLLNPS